MNYSTINYQELFDLVKANENAKQFNLKSWVNICGTYGCLRGNHLLSQSQSTDNYTKINLICELEHCGARSNPYNITTKEYHFLFRPRDYKLGRYGYHYISSKLTAINSYSRDCDDKEAAIRRVLKFMYYKMHKREMIYEEDGRVKESARRNEGDHNVLRGVLAKC